MSILDPIPEHPDTGDGVTLDFDVGKPPRPHLQLVAAPARTDLPARDRENEIAGEVIEARACADDRPAGIPIPGKAELAAPIHASDGNGTRLDPITEDMSVPEGYLLSPQGVFRWTGEEDTSEFICSPLRVEAMFADHDGRGWGRLRCARPRRSTTVRSADISWHV